MRNTGLVWVMALSACGVVTEQGVYEGIRQQQQIRREPSLPDSQPLPDFDTFKQERQKLKPSAE